MRKARVYPVNLRKKANRRKVAESRKRAKLFKRHSVLRTAFKSRLRISTPTKKAWKYFLTAKQRRTFIKRGQKFLDALFHDVWSCPHYKGFQPEFHRDCGCTGGGLVGAPTLRLEYLHGGDGEYNSGITNPRGFSITIDYDRDERPSTFLHEIVHWIDALSGLKKARYVGSHSKAFFKRLEDLAEQLKYRDLTL